MGEIKVKCLTLCQVYVGCRGIGSGVGTDLEKNGKSGVVSKYRHLFPNEDC